ncbi:hypothetical protein NB636_07865 [Oxalobacter aliiformigenes]|uniref:hypothetical protein n=1 Tax=Oxalobacter aliiformigenes TaxID=2946593 RepID=UPI0022AE580C|nr:hypothetical protein [Oxalobacter aliiformigenes]MCZ4065745.1 hypothetical protein [Oxalobacter aliiformigenes]WAV98623.1 hypothetical protein NB636_07865 [Oxalobacter aliiformigenes]
MSTIGMSSVQAALADFIDQRVLSAIGDDNSLLKWAIGGASTVALARFDKMVAGYIPMLTGLGLMDESKNLNIEATEAFVKSAFEKQATVSLPVMGVPITFDKQDGDALVTLLKKYGGQ